MAEENLAYTLTLATRATGTGAKQTAEDLKKVEVAADKVNSKTAETPAKTQAAQSGMGKMGMVASQASYQVTDFTNQVSMGTSAVTAFAQQAPQLIGAFQMAGLATGGAALALSGFAVALPIAAIAGKSLYSWLTNTTTATESFAKSIEDNMKKAGDSIESLNTERVEKANRKILKAVEDNATLAKTYDETEKAEGKASIAAISNAEATRTAQIAVAEALGMQIDKYAEIEIKQAAAAAKRQEENRQAIAAENAKLEKAVADQTKLTNEIAAREQIRQARAAELALAEKNLETMRAERTELEKILKSPTAMSVRKDEARTQLRSGEGTFQAQQKFVDDSRKKLEEAALAVSDMQAAFDDSVKMVNDLTSATSVSISTLQTTLANNDLVAQADTALAQGKELVAGMKGALDEITPTTQAGIQAKDDALKILADGRVTQEEVARLIKDLQTLIGTMQTGVSGVNGNVATMIQMMSQFQTQQAAQAAELQRIRQQQERLASMTGPLPAR